MTPIIAPPCGLGLRESILGRVIVLRAIAVPRSFDAPRVAQVIQAAGETYVFATGERSEVLRLDGDRLVSTRSPFMVGSPPRVPRITRLGDGTLAVPDREHIHAFDGQEWTSLPMPSRVRAAWGPTFDELLAIRAQDGAVLERDRDTWPEAPLPEPNAGFTRVHGADSIAVALGTVSGRSRIAWRRHGVWRQGVPLARGVTEVHAFAPDHLVARSVEAVHVHRGLAWDALRLEIPEGATLDFVEGWRGHTVVGGLDDRRRAWAQLGRRVRYRFELSGPEVTDDLFLAWLDKGVALAGGHQLWVSEPFESLARVAFERAPLEPAERRSRTVRVPDTVAPSSTEGAGFAVDAFEIDRAPVTNRQWALVAGTLGLGIPRHWSGGRMPPGREDHPVVGISAGDALRYATSRGMRLPTEHEWERAALGIARNAPEDAPAHVALHQRTRPVTSPSPASTYGVEHVGMVWEWTSTPEGEGHIVRGGPWRDGAPRTEVSNRSFETGPAPDLGFRCARSLGEAPSKGSPNPYR